MESREKERQARKLALSQKRQEHEAKLKAQKEEEEKKKAEDEEKVRQEFLDRKKQEKLMLLMVCRSFDQVVNVGSLSSRKKKRKRDTLKR